MTYVRELKSRWQELTATYPSELIEKWWVKLEEEYNNERRKYHNLKHIHQMFEHYDKCINKLENKDSVAFAIFFHDFIYNPKASNNEEKSAEIFNEFAKEMQITQESELYIQVQDLILLTKTHLTEAHMDQLKTGSDDQHYFLDFDMAILGNSLQDYNNYSQQIRQEYHFLADTNYNELRVKVLKSFIQIPNIFATDEFRRNYEEKARENIQNEIERLN